MNIRNGLVASASALGLMLTSQGAGAFDMMEVGEWKVEFSGNVNGFVSDVKLRVRSGGTRSVGPRLRVAFRRRLRRQ